MKVSDHNSKAENFNVLYIDRFLVDGESSLRTLTMLYHTRAQLFKTSLAKSLRPQLVK